MTVTATSAVFSIAPQAAKIGDGAFAHGSHTWYKFATLDADYGAAQRQDMMPQELKGQLTPSGAYKSAAWAQGGASMLPRLEDDLGWLLFAACGSVSTVSDAPVAGAYTHIFKFNASDHTDIPWLAARKWIPGSTAADSIGEFGYDNLVAALGITIPQMGLVRTRVDLQGRVPGWEENPSWSYTNDFEDFTSIPVACKGSVKLEGDETKKFTNAQFNLVNDLTTPQEELVLGAYYPDDFAVRARRAEIAFTYKWADPNLYQQLMTGAVDGTEWAPDPVTYETSGANNAIEISVQSPALITGTTPYELKIISNYAVLQAAGAPRLVPGGMLMLPVTATLLQPDSDTYVEIHLINGVTSYTWPS